MKRENEIIAEADYSYEGNYKALQKLCFIDGAKWADKTMIEKACEWLKEKNKMCMYELEMILGKDFIEDFKKAMEE